MVLNPVPCFPAKGNALEVAPPPRRSALRRAAPHALGEEAARRYGGGAVAAHRRAERRFQRLAAVLHGHRRRSPLRKSGAGDWGLAAETVGAGPVGWASALTLAFGASPAAVKSPRMGTNGPSIELTPSPSRAVEIARGGVALGFRPACISFWRIGTNGPSMKPTPTSSASSSAAVVAPSVAAAAAAARCARRRRAEMGAEL